MHHKAKQNSKAMGRKAKLQAHACILLVISHILHQGPVVRSLVSANRWLRGIKTYRFPWYLTLVSAKHASSNPGQSISNQRLK